MFGGGPSNDELKITLSSYEQQHAFYYISRKVEFGNLLELKQSTNKMNLMSRQIDNYGDNFYSKLDHQELELMGDMDDEAKRERLEAHKAHQYQLEQEAEELKKEAEAKHEALLKEKEEMLDHEQDNFDEEENMEHNLENNLQNLNMGININSNTEINQTNLNLIQQQLITLHQHLADLQGSVKQNEIDKVSLQGEANLDTINKAQSEDPDLAEEDDQSKTALEAKVSIVQQQIDTMEHQLNIIKRKHEKMKLKEQG